MKSKRIITAENDNGLIKITIEVDSKSLVKEEHHEAMDDIADDVMFDLSFNRFVSSPIHKQTVK